MSTGTAPSFPRAVMSIVLYSRRRDERLGVKGASVKTRRMRQGVLVLLLLLTGCGTFGPAPSPPGLDVPRIANLRFEPDEIAPGAVATMHFYFEVGSADLAEGFLIDQGIAQFQFFTALQPITFDLRSYAGHVAGFAELPVLLSTEGVRWLEFYVVSRKGNVSNRLRARLTVR